MTYNVIEGKYFKFEEDNVVNENNFELLLSKIGRSTTARVDLMVHKKSRFLGAMKIYSGHLRELQAEVETLLIGRDCPFLLHLVDRFVTPDSAGATVCKYYMLLEYAAFGTLDDLTQAVKGIGPEKSKFYIMEIASGLKFLHSQNIMHRDVKPANMLVRVNGHVALGDFGLSMYATNGCRSICGTYLTRPPEVWSHEPYSLPIDSWMCGIAIYNIITNKWPFLSPNKEKHLYLIKAAKLPSDSSLTPESSDLLKKLLIPDPVERLPVGNILDHPYITSLQQPCVPPYTPAELLAVLSLSDQEKNIIQKLIEAT